MTNNKNQFYIMNVFGEERAYIMNPMIRKMAGKETFSLSQLEFVAKAFATTLTQVPKPSSFPAQVGQVV